VPDIGDYHDVPVIDVCVKVGDTVKVDDALVTLESDKATMDVPSSVAGVVREIRVKLGDKVSEGAVVVVVDSGGGSAVVAAVPAAAAPVAPVAAEPVVASVPVPAVPAAPPGVGLAPGARTHASPSVRLLARELGVDLNKVTASGPKGRILKEDVTAYVKGVMTAPSRRSPWLPHPRSAAVSTCCPGRRSTSPNSAPSKSNRWRGSRRSPRRTWRVTG
jgi:pyruvate dehydrogenase E2 component (dihydrolipoamide acetyltransferase)